jgi:hypothetical protein
MAALTGAAKTARVDVITAMATVAVRGLFYRFVNRHSMACIATQVFMFTIQLELCLCVVIELPQGPVIRGVALFTVRPKALFMDIIVGMASAAFECGIFEGLLKMALLTGSRRVLAYQGETGQVMVKPDFVAEILFIMATLTVFALLPLVNIVGLMTTDAGGLELLL